MADPVTTAAQTSIPPRRKRMSAEQRREQLLESARAVFLRAGASGTRTKDIAEEAGVSEAMLYQHFSSKQEIFQAAVLEPLERLVGELASVGPRLAGLGGRDRRAASYTLHEHVFSSMLEIAPLLGVALFSDQESGQRFFQEHMKPLIARMNHWTQAGLEGWEHPDADPEMVAAVILGSYNWLALQASFSDRDFDVNKLAHQLTDLLVAGLRLI